MLPLHAVQTIVLTDKDEMLAEENLPVRAMLLDEGLRLSREMIKGAENDMRSQQLLAQALMMEAKVLPRKGGPRPRRKIPASGLWKFWSDRLRRLRPMVLTANGSPT